MNQNQTKVPRLTSLDALRGLDMIFLCGLGNLFANLCKLSNVDWIYQLADQTKHVDWVGLRAQDLIYSLFLFCVGMSISYAIVGKLERGVARKGLVIKIVKRVILLSIFGLIYDGMLMNGHGKGQSILGMIAVAYGITSFIVLYSKNWRSPLYWMVSIWIILTMIRFLVPAPGYGAGDFTPKGSINNVIDTFVFGGYDTEGILCMISGTTMTLAGVLAGYIVRNRNTSHYKKLGILAISGVAALALGMLVNPWIPVIRKMWTVSFDLYSIGISTLLFSLFYLIIDVWKFQRWAFFFTVIGMNPITIYLLSRFIDFKHTAQYIVGVLASSIGDKGESVVMFTAILGIKWILLYYLYKKRIFLRV